MATLWFRLGTTNGEFDFFGEFHGVTPKTPIYITGYDSTTDDGSETEAYARFYIKSQIKVMESIWSYNIVSFLAEVGGYVGLLLGVSLYTILTVYIWLVPWWCRWFTWVLQFATTQGFF